MYKSGHLGVSMLLWAPIALAFVLAGAVELAILGGAGVLALASFPDVDHRLPRVSHRGFTHTLAFAVVVGIVAGGLVLAVARVGGTEFSPADSLSRAAFAFAVGTFGVLAHVAGDVLTPLGVPLFWPASDRRYTVAYTTAANPVSNALLFAAGVIAAAAVAVVAHHVA